ncbi:MAG: hypothetical protein KAT68_19185, partial [Bacteroidales bacterium]|nr:hypothetical protein [Bacteroidales bacterium]
MRSLLKILWTIFITFILSGLIIILIVVPNNEIFKSFSDFASIFLSSATILLVIISLLKQNIENSKSKIENHFFNMLNYHNDNVKSLCITDIKTKTKTKEKVEGRRAFLIFRSQLSRLLDIVEKINSELELNLDNDKIIDIAYICYQKTNML